MECSEIKYKSFNVGSEKFATGKFLKFVMVDSRPIMDQVHELQLICKQFAEERMKFCETFTVNCFIEKLPPPPLQVEKISRIELSCLQAKSLDVAKSDYQASQ